MSALPPIRYVGREISWMFRAGYQGRGVPQVQEIIMRVTVSRRFRRFWKGCHCYGEFTPYADGRQVKDDGLPGHRVTHVKNHHLPCGRSGY